MKKRGSSHVDWVISLGIFLLYIAWIFIFLKPQIEKAAELSPLEATLEKNFKEDSYWQALKYPLFIDSEKIQNATPVFFNFSPEYGEEGFYLSDDYYYYNSQLFMLLDFNNSTSYIDVIEANTTYNHTNRKLDIEKSGDKITTSKSFEANFQNGVLEKASYKGELIIKNATFKVDSYSFPTNYTYSDLGIVGIYSKETQSLSLYSRIIAKNSIIWLSAEKTDPDTENDLNIALSLKNFNSFFSDNAHFGNISEDTCEEYENDFLKLNNSDISISFMLPEDTAIAFCKNGTTINLTLSITVDDDKNLFIVFDNSTFQESDFSGYTSKKGLSVTRQGLSLENIAGLSYNEKKTEWGYPSQRNFQIIVWNSTINKFNRTEPLLEMGNDPLGTIDVYSKEYSDFILKDSGSLEEVTVNIKTW